MKTVLSVFICLGLTEIHINNVEEACKVRMTVNVKPDVVFS